VSGPVEVRPNIRAALAASTADESGLDIRQPDIIGPLVGGQHLDPDRETDRARQAFDTHLARARWMTEHGYRQLLRGDASA
jgi:hypothetical protein